MGSPSLLDAQATSVLSRMNAVLRAAQNHIEQGGVVTDGGTTQASGANTAPNLDLDVDLLIAQVKGKPHFLAAAADVDSDAGDTVVWGATSGKASKAAVVLETGAANDTPAYLILPGTVADTADSVVLTEDEISALVAHDNWILLADATFTRTGDTTITVALSYARRGGVRGRVADSGSFDVDLAVTEADFRNYGA